MSKTKTPPIRPPANTDIREARLRLIACGACFYCRGRDRHLHQPPGLTVIDVIKFDPVKKAQGSALFQMNKGAVIVAMNGLTEMRWWWPAVETAMAVYDSSISDLLRP